MQLRRRQHRRGARRVRPPARDQVPIQNRNHNATRGIGVDAASTMSTIAQNAIASVAPRSPGVEAEENVRGRWARPPTARAAVRIPREANVPSANMSSRQAR